jgi:hypothetical protein
MAFPQSGMNHVLLSGCRDDEYSFDALIEGAYHGAMTYFAVKAIEEAGYDLTYADLAARLGSMLETAGYNQHPQLEGESHAKHRKVFR